jgi:hypothetical protein
VNKDVLIVGAQDQRKLPVVVVGSASGGASIVARVLGALRVVLGLV